ncbi:MAG: helix-turn-helix domain-containing protein [Caulobacteraceae bacterium]
MARAASAAAKVSVLIIPHPRVSWGDESRGRGKRLAGEGVGRGVARALGMSLATLRRRLAAEGQNFRGIRDSVRRDTAWMLLGSDRSVKEIAALLRLSDPRSLRRVCREWFDASPTEIRRALARKAVRQP